MDFKTKRRIKKLAKLYFTLSWVFAIIFTFSITAIIFTVASTTEKNPAFNNLIWIIGSTFVIALVFDVVAMYFTAKRETYLARIKQYKQRVYFNTIINLIKNNDFKKAVDIHNNCLKTGNLKDFTFAYIISASQYSKDKERKQIGDEALGKFREYFKPEDVKF